MNPFKLFRFFNKLVHYFGPDGNWFVSQLKIALKTCNTTLFAYMFHKTISFSIDNKKNINIGFRKKRQNNSHKFRILYYPIQQLKFNDIPLIWKQKIHKQKKTY